MPEYEYDVRLSDVPGRLSPPDIQAVIREALMRYAVRAYREMHGAQAWPSEQFLNQYLGIGVEVR